MFADQVKKIGRILRKSQEQGEPLGHRNLTAQATMSRYISSRFVLLCRDWMRWDSDCWVLFMFLIEMAL